MRAAAREEPKELEELRRVLYPPREATPLPRLDYSRPIPTHVHAGAELAEQGVAEMAPGRDGQAVDFLERALRLDPSRNDVTALPALAYLLRGDDLAADGDGVRRVAAPAGARPDGE